MGILSALVGFFTGEKASDSRPQSAGWPPPGFEGFTVVESYVAGAKRNENQPAVSALRTGDVLTAIPEPENPHDRNAIALVSPRGDKIGYVPRDSTTPLHQAMREGGTMRAAVKNVWVRGYEGRGNLAVDIYLGWRLLSVRDRSAARAAGAITIDLGRGGKMGVRGISRVDAYYRLLQGIEAARKVGQHMDAYSYCIQSLDYLGDLAGVECFFRDGQFIIASVPAIEIGAAYAAVLDDEPRLALIEVAVSARPEFTPWLADVHQARRMQAITRDLRVLLDQDPGCLQAAIPKRLGVVGKDSSKVVKYLEGMGLLVRKPQGSSYALEFVEQEVSLPEWFQ